LFVVLMYWQFTPHGTEEIVKEYNFCIHLIDVSWQNVIFCDILFYFKVGKSWNVWIFENYLVFPSLFVQKVNLLKIKQKIVVKIVFSIHNISMESNTFGSLVPDSRCQNVFFAKTGFNKRSWKNLRLSLLF
jgi:hypothetical protein